MSSVEVVVAGQALTAPGAVVGSAPVTQELVMRAATEFPALLALG